MPNLSIFIAWGFLSFLTPYFSGELAQRLNEVSEWMLHLLLPILIGYLGGKITGNQRGAIVGAIATLGIIVGSTAPQIVGAMIMGTLAGKVYDFFENKVKEQFTIGYEMLIHNLLVGIIGGVCCLLGMIVITPLISSVSQMISQAILWLTEMKMLTLAHVLLEPLKVLFFNNIINHGILTPLGIEFAQQENSSILFLMEANPGPGIGVLLAILFQGRRETKTNAGSALMIQAIGGIHEIYFPFVLIKPKLVLAVILGGASGTFLFQLLHVGLSAPVSPGSLIVILTNTPTNQLLAVSFGILVSILVTFSCALFLLRKEAVNVEQEKSNDEEREEMQLAKNKKIIFACDSGMGSSAMGAALLKKQLQVANLPASVDYASIYQVKDQPDQLIIVQSELTVLAQQQAPNSQILSLDHFLEVENSLPKIKSFLLTTTHMEKSAEIAIEMDRNETEKVVFLYAENIRGSQTMGMTILAKLAKKQGRSLSISKLPIEQLVGEKETIYVATTAFFHKYPQLAELSKIVLVEHFVLTTTYEQWMKGGVEHVLVHKGKTID
ncbi:PTS transporter subunit EIIC [Enterococcus thailandicus]|uniref:PTS transporter subunit EIIC n=1 Tax=Enterococcus TaxID=1350 RepID=UPI000A34E747|nr:MULTISPECIES: PTS transporter subunit EIIC [Enterococcus]MDT2751167.1 PTS transporter subunit EIIC [Enterococcus thailandicus]MDT2775506.1 PTS transporter subunit EIIC [Enterococcus thailandicus]MDT2794370.1 PTS transporter subunit EIIC [Enterococcus thailandicus]MDT2845371.1 PTS transporter subunit EIIC [Enterococcus thailandicus]